MFCSQRNWISFDLNSYFQILQKCRFSVCAFFCFCFIQHDYSYFELCFYFPSFQTIVQNHFQPCPDNSWGFFLSLPDLDQLSGETRGKPKSLPKWCRPDLNTVLPTFLQVVSLIGISSDRKKLKLKVPTLLKPLFEQQLKHTGRVISLEETFL